MKKFFIKTFGCKTNQIESSIIEAKLLRLGYELSNENYDILIVNSCTVTNVADNKTLQFIRSVKHANPNVKVILAGCMPQFKKEALLKLDYLDLILGNEEKLKIDKYIDFSVNYAVGDIFSVSEFQNYDIEKVSRTRANLKVQDGCNNKCSYCAINIARGKSRSNSLHNILKQVAALTKNGYKEIILTGIHLNLWGIDLFPKSSLLELIEAIDKTSIERFRIGSLYPNELSDELLNVLKKSEKFCPHFHLSLQSLNSKILNLMNRFYSQELCIEKINQIKEIFPNAFIGADIIVGFPFESDDDFLITKNNVQKLPFSNIHVFPFSKRENTVAAKMDGQVSELIKKQRAMILKNIAIEKYNNFLFENLNKPLFVLVEKIVKNSAIGLSENYIEVEIPLNNIIVEKNSIVKVIGKSIDKNKIIAEIL